MFKHFSYTAYKKNKIFFFIIENNIGEGSETLYIGTLQYMRIK
jgi:hypothetical protein